MAQSFHKRTLELRVQFASDTVVVPKESAHFGFYAENSFGPAIPVKEVRKH